MGVSTLRWFDMMDVSTLLILSTECSQIPRETTMRPHDTLRQVPAVLGMQVSTPLRVRQRRTVYREYFFQPFQPLRLPV
jgi:hypothetical protein